MILQEIMNNIKNDKYENKIDFPNSNITGNERVAMVRAYHNENTRLYNLFLDDIKQVLNKSLGYNGTQTEILFNYAWDQSHSEGVVSVLDTLEDIVDIVVKFTSAKD